MYNRTARKIPSCLRKGQLCHYRLESPRRRWSQQTQGHRLASVFLRIFEKLFWEVCGRGQETVSGFTSVRASGGVVVWTEYLTSCGCRVRGIGYFVSSASEVFKALFQFLELGQMKKSGRMKWMSEQGMEKRVETWSLCCREIWIHTDSSFFVAGSLQNLHCLWCSAVLVTRPCVGRSHPRGNFGGHFQSGNCVLWFWELLLTTSSFPSCIYLELWFYWMLDFLFWSPDFLIILSSFPLCLFLFGVCVCVQFLKISLSWSSNPTIQFFLCATIFLLSKSSFVFRIFL